MKLPKILAIVALMSTLISCGGGGEDGGYGLLSPQINYYGAIAVNTTTGAAGITANYRSQSEANTGAQMQCGLFSCNVVLEYGPNMCAAVARGTNGVVLGWASDRSLSDAKSKALNQCALNRGIGCEIKLEQCNS